MAVSCTMYYALSPARHKETGAKRKGLAMKNSRWIACLIAVLIFTGNAQAQNVIEALPGEEAGAPPTTDTAARAARVAPSYADMDDDIPF